MRLIFTETNPPQLVLNDYSFKPVGSDREVSVSVFVVLHALQRSCLVILPSSRSANKMILLITIATQSLHYAYYTCISNLCLRSGLLFKFYNTVQTSGEEGVTQNVTVRYIG